MTTKITKSQLREMIKEAVLKEQSEDDIAILQSMLSYFEYRIYKSGPSSEERTKFRPYVSALKRLIANSSKEKPFA